MSRASDWKGAEVVFVDIAPQVEEARALATEEDARITAGQALLAEAETATDPTRIAEVQTRLTDIDAWSAEARASSILRGLGFETDQHSMPCSAFSGGWRMRVAFTSVKLSPCGWMKSKTPCLPGLQPVMKVGHAGLVTGGKVESRSPCTPPSIIAPRLVSES